VNRLHKSVAAALQDPKVKGQFAASGADPVGNTPDEFAALIRSELVKWAAVVKAAGIKPE
jgi:tripartite-type tricarboxylate transporter receptor subunit TctC